MDFDLSINNPPKSQEQPMTDQPQEEQKAETNQESSQNTPSNPEEVPEPEGEWESISGLVNQDLAKQLQEVGYSKNVSEKALLYTKNFSLDKAFEWIEEHKNDPDFENEEKIQKTQAKSRFAGMTAEEKKVAIRELQDKLRKDREEKEKQMERDREKERMRSTKEIAQAKRKMEEMEIKRIAELRKKEKMETIKAKQQMMELLRKDKEERFGKKFGAGGAVIENKKTPKESMEHALKTIRTLYKEDRFPGVASTCIKTLSTLIGNIAANPENEKYKSINLENQTFQKKVGKITGGLLFLKAVGFREISGKLELVDLNMDNINTALSLLK